MASRPRWIAGNPIGFGVGWEPYPISLRICNWIKWHLSGNRLQTAAVESLFLQAEAAERGFIAGNAAALFKEAVTESFRILGVPDYENAAQLFYSQPSDKVNIDVSANKIRTIILQKWAALNAYDPFESYSDWRRLGIPADLPVSEYPGTTAPHIPYRLLYPTSEYHYNAANVNDQGTVNQFTSKIFWMP